MTRLSELSEGGGCHATDQLWLETRRWEDTALHRVRRWSRCGSWRPCLHREAVQGGLPMYVCTTTWAIGGAEREINARHQREIACWSTSDGFDK